MVLNNVILSAPIVCIVLVIINICLSYCTDIQWNLITYTFSYFVFTYVLFIHFILDIENGVLYPFKQLDHFLGNWHSHFSVLPHISLIRDCFRTWLLASVISSQTFRLFNLSPVHPSYLSPKFLNIRWQIKPKTHGHEPSVTDVSKPNETNVSKMSCYSRHTS